MPDTNKTLQMSPLLHNESAVEEFSYASSQGTNPLTKQDMETIQTLAPASGSLIWKPDRILSAYHYSVNMIDTIGEWKAMKNVERAVDKSPHTDEMPRTFIRGFSQIDPRIYSLWKMRDRNWTEYPDALHNSDISKGAFREFWHQHTFRDIKGWLAALPFKPYERVYVAKLVECTLMMEWEMFMEHWDSFCSPYNITNLINDDPRWYIHFHQDDVIAFGCTSEFAAEKKLEAGSFEQESVTLNDNLQQVVYFERNARERMSVGLYNQSISEPTERN